MLPRACRLVPRLWNRKKIRREGCSTFAPLIACRVDNTRTGKRSPKCRCWAARFGPGERWPSRLVATAQENRLSFRRAQSAHIVCGSYRFADASPIRKAASSPRFSAKGFFVQNLLLADDRLNLRGFERVPVLKPLAASFGRGPFLSLALRPPGPVAPRGSRGARSSRWGHPPTRQDLP
jgi:hypothetical protein